ncbi:MAG TPA: hypothetical protein VD994_03280, partial [Prosthecobacter sp.]|nr:hypothetical protein [Prosthecobacter sp.]
RNAESPVRQVATSDPRKPGRRKRSKAPSEKLTAADNASFAADLREVTEKLTRADPSPETEQSPDPSTGQSKSDREAAQ